MKKLIATLALAAVGLTACDTAAKGRVEPTKSESTDASISSTVNWVNLGDGHEVRCVFEFRTNSSGGGPSCDWNTVRAR